MKASESSRNIGIAKLELLYDGLPLAIGGNLLLAITMLVVLWHEIESTDASVWLVSLFILQLVRLGFIYAFKSAYITNNHVAGLWLTRFRFFAIATGVIWGIAAWAFFPDDLIDQVFLAFVLVGLNAGAIITMATDRISVISFVVCVMGPLILNFIMESHGVSLAMGAMIFMFMVIFISSIARLRKTLLLNEQTIQETYEHQKALDRQQSLTQTIAEVQSEFIGKADWSQAFGSMLTSVLKLTKSTYGFIGVTTHEKEGTSYLTIDTVDSIVWNDKTRAYYQSKVGKKVDISNASTMFGSIAKRDQPLIINDPEIASTLDGLPIGAPRLEALLAIPIYRGSELIAILGLANCPYGYSLSLAEFLQPLIFTINQLIGAARIQQENRENQRELRRLSRVASQTTNGVVITDTDGYVTWINDGFTRMTGYTLDDLLGHKPGEILQGPLSDAANIEKMRDALSWRQSFEIDMVNYTKQGKAFWVRIQCSPLRDDAGVHQGYIAIESDITQEKQAEKELRDTTNLLESIFDNVPSMIFLKEADSLRFKYLNRAGETLLGHTREEILGRNDYDFFPQEQADFFTSKDREVLKRSGIVDIPEELVDTPKGTRVLHTRKIALHDEKDQPQYLLGICEDITDSKKTEETIKASEYRLRALFELSPIGIALNDYETGDFIQINEALYAVTGYTRDEFTNLSYWDLTPEEYQPQELEQLESMEKTGRYGPYEKEYIRKDGTRYPVLLNGMVVYDNNGRKLIWSIVEDISERKRVERLKNEFISTVSHELRTPVTAIYGALGLLLGGVLGKLPAQANEVVDIAHKNSQRLGVLINDLLDMEKLVSGKMSFKLEVQPLLPVLKRAVRENQSYADRFKVDLLLSEISGDILVNIDTQRTLQVLANLISNAAKFSPVNGKVKISVDKSDHRVRIAIIDEGPGIPEEFRQRIFEKFAQADSSDSRAVGGSGLGLAITQELIQKMGGTIGFDTKLGEGTTFYFDLPLDMPENRPSLPNEFMLH